MKKKQSYLLKLFLFLKPYIRSYVSIKQKLNNHQKPEIAKLAMTLKVSHRYCIFYIIHSTKNPKKSIYEI